MQHKVLLGAKDARGVSNCLVLLTPATRLLLQQLLLMQVLPVPLLLQFLYVPRLVQLFCCRCGYLCC